MHPLTFLLPYVLPATLVVALALGGHAWVLVPLVAFGLIPVLDSVLGNDDSTRDDEARRPWLFDGLMAAWLPVQLGLLAVVLVMAPSFTAAQLVGFGLAFGLLAGAGGITVAHELCHRKARWARASAEVLMTVVLYPWFTVEHVLGHHKNVATPLDPATSRLGESVYGFWLRSVTGGLRSAWRLESERVHKRRIAGLADRRVRMPLGLAVVVGLAAALGGVPGLVLLAVQGVVAFSLLEVVNYVEHYGMARAQLPSGRYERVQPHHSWNSTRGLTNRFLFNLPRHADHHAFAYRPYDHLRPWSDAPELPMGYPTMVLLALVPPLWRRVMDPKVACLHVVESHQPVASK